MTHTGETRIGSALSGAKCVKLYTGKVFPHAVGSVATHGKTLDVRDAALLQASTCCCLLRSRAVCSINGLKVLTPGSSNTSCVCFEVGWSVSETSLATLDALQE